MQSNEELSIPQSNIWDAVLDMNWSLVQEECSSCPLNARYIDGDYDETPLHLAIHNAAPLDAIMAIVDAYPKSVRISSRGNRDLPLHIACRYQADVEILKVLLARDPTTAMCETKHGKKPLNALWENADADMKKTQEFWSKVEVLLSAVARSRYEAQMGDDSKKEFLLHAAVSLGARSCPIEILQYLLKENPKLASQRDWSRHRLPLHIAVGPTSWSNETRRKYKPRERTFIRLLLAAHPKGAEQTLSQRYPLHLALSNRHCWSEGVSDLIRAAPEVLLRPDPVTKLYPFQLAAIPVGDTSVDLDTVFWLLRSQPDVLGFFDLIRRDNNKQRSLTTTTTTKGIYNLPRFIQSFFV